MQAERAAHVRVDEIDFDAAAVVGIEEDASRTLARQEPGALRDRGRRLRRPAPGSPRPAFAPKQINSWTCGFLNCRVPSLYCVFIQYFSLFGKRPILDDAHPMPDDWPSTPGLPAYAELFCLSNFSFLQGASHAEELVARAVQLGYAALALTDECSLAGVVRAHAEAKRAALPLIVGAHFHLVRPDGAGAVADAAGAEPQRLRQPVRTDHARTHAQREGKLPAAPVRHRCARREPSRTWPACRTAWRSCCRLSGPRSGRRRPPARSRPLDGADLPGPRLDRPEPAAPRLRRSAPRHRRGSRLAARPADRRARPRRDARAFAQAAAGHADRHASASRWPNAATSWRRTPSSTCARACAWRTSIRARRCTRPAHRPPVHLLARRTALRIPGRSGPARPHGGQLPAQRNLYRRAPALREGSRPRCRRRSSTSWR
jgi:hypothetical protein